VDPVTQLRLTRELVDIDSTTGREGEAGAFIAATLRRLGYHVVEQPVSEGRFNVVATIDSPVVVLSTHFDCVPPFIASRESSGRLYGRGSCDAKGTLVAQIAAAERLRAAGERRVGLLFVVGEERGSDGAKLANTISAGSQFLINGEPTDNRLGRATRGVYRVRLRAAGRAAHSSQPELGESAIEKLIDAIVELRGLEWPADPDLGTTYYTVGLIRGGVAPNVIPPEADAEVMFRTVGKASDLRTMLDAKFAGRLGLEDVLDVPPVRLRDVPGFDQAVFSFTTDIPFLETWGEPLLVGPGSVTLAHTSDEHVEISDLEQAVEIYARLSANLIAETA
jgi:acetylornithine deacetylase